jgi:hypothetical protein
MASAMPALPSPSVAIPVAILGSCKATRCGAVGALFCDGRQSRHEQRQPVLGFVPEENLLGRAFMIWSSTAQPKRMGLKVKWGGLRNFSDDIF